MSPQALIVHNEADMLPHPLLPGEFDGGFLRGPLCLREDFIGRDLH